MKPSFEKNDKAKVPVKITPAASTRLLLIKATHPLLDAQQALMAAIEMTKTIDQNTTCLPPLPEVTMRKARKCLEWICEVYLVAKKRAEWYNAGNLCRHCGREISKARLRTRARYCTDEHASADRLLRYRIKRNIKKIPDLPLK